MKLILVRHTSVGVEKGVCYGRTDVPLAASFPDEAREVKQMLSNYDISVAYCSPLSRCRALAAYCGYGDAVIDSRLREMDFGEWEMKRFDEITDPTLMEWYDDYIDVCPTGGESSAMQRDRFIDFVASIDDGSHRTVVLFTHGGILIHAIACSRGIPYCEMFGNVPPFGAIVEVESSRLLQGPRPGIQRVG